MLESWKIVVPSQSLAPNCWIIGCFEWPTTIISLHFQFGTGFAGEIVEAQINNIDIRKNLVNNYQNLDKI